jgi:hypothetical protein
VKSDPVGIDIRARDQIINHGLGHPLRIRWGIQFFFSEGPAVSWSVYIDERHAAAHVLPGSAVFAAQQDPIGSAVVVNNGKTASQFASSRIEKSIEPVALIRDLHLLEGRRNETPSLVKILL